MLPSRICTTLSTTSDSCTMGSWLAMRIVFPWALKSLIICINSRESLVSRWAVGSSAMITAGIINQGSGNSHSLGFSAGEPFHLGGGLLRQIEHFQQAHGLIF